MATIIHHRGDDVQTLLDHITTINLRADYQKTLALLKALKDGALTLAQVQLTPGGWALVQVAEAPEEPAEEVAPAA